MYGNYPSYNPVPADPAMIEMQERLKRMQQAYRPVPPQPAMQYGGIKGRMVTSVDEARAAQIDFDGSLNYFPAPAEGKIYVKSIGLDGLPVFEVYQRVDAAQKQQPVYVESGALAAMPIVMQNLPKRICLTRMRRKAKFLIIGLRKCDNKKPLQKQGLFC